MQDEIQTSKRDLIARVATLELLVADLVHILWQVSPASMEKLAADARHDLEIGHTKISLPVGDHQRDRLYSVLQTRQRMLKRKRIDAPA